jgi:hypothetical protein
MTKDSNEPVIDKRYSKFSDISSLGRDCNKISKSAEDGLPFCTLKVVRIVMKVINHIQNVFLLTI